MAVQQRNYRPDCPRLPLKCFALTNVSSHRSASQRCEHSGCAPNILREHLLLKTSWLLVTSIDNRLSPHVQRDRPRLLYPCCCRPRPANRKLHRGNPSIVDSSTMLCRRELHNPGGRSYPTFLGLSNGITVTFGCA